MSHTLIGKKILFATVPNDSHIHPLTGLAKLLQHAGCDVRWYTSCIFEQKFRRLEIPHIPFTNAVDINPLNIDYLLPERAEISEQMKKQNFDLKNVYADRAEEYFSDIQFLHKSFPFVMMIADNMFSAIPLVKKKLKVPVISIGINPLAEESADLGSYGLAAAPAQTIRQFEEQGKLREFINTVIFKSSIDTYDNILKDYNIRAKRSVLTDLLIKQADLHLQIGIPGFEYKRSDMGENIRFIGALMPYAKRRSLKSWFDVRLLRHHKIILVSQGTSVQDVKVILEPTLQAFRNSDYLVIATTGGNKTQALRDKFPEKNLIIESFIPFDDIMPYVSVCITNGGFLTTLTSIRHKVPVITAGMTAGKNEVSARVEHFNCGINLNTAQLKTKEIREAVQKILTDNCYKEAVTQLSNELNTYNPEKLCTSFIADLLNLSSSTSQKRNLVPE